MGDVKRYEQFMLGLNKVMQVVKADDYDVLKIQEQRLSADYARLERERDALVSDAARVEQSVREHVAGMQVRIDAQSAELTRLRAVETAAKDETMRAHMLAQQRDEARECVGRLQRSSQAVLDRWRSPTWQWYNQGPTADLMNALRDALAATPEHLRNG